jgi:NAD(P)H-nitrite reductase large subunit
MAGTKYLIVGAGMTAAAAVIRSVDSSGTITLVGAEPDPPYNRPPRSKAQWKGGTIDDTLDRRVLDRPIGTEERAQ